MPRSLKLAWAVLVALLALGWATPPARAGTYVVNGCLAGPDGWQLEYSGYDVYPLLSYGSERQCPYDPQAGRLGLIAASSNVYENSFPAPLRSNIAWTLDAPTGTTIVQL